MRIRREREPYPFHINPADYKNLPDFFISVVLTTVFLFHSYYTFPVIKRIHFKEDHTDEK